MKMLWNISKQLKELELREQVREFTEKVRREELGARLEKTKNNCTKVYNLLPR